MNFSPMQKFNKVMLLPKAVNNIIKSENYVITFVCVVLTFVDSKKVLTIKNQKLWKQINSKETGMR